MQEEALLAGRLRKALDKILRKVKGRRVAVLFSGGFDSIFLARAAQRYGARLNAVTIAFEKYNSSTVKEAVRAARALDVPHEVIAVSRDEYLRSCVGIRRLQDKKEMDWDLPLVHAALEKAAGRGGLFIAGMGSDEWLGERSGAADNRARLARAARSRRAHEQVAAERGQTIMFPFLTPEVLEIARKVPLALKRGKKLLRSLDPDADRIARSLRRAGPATVAQVPRTVRLVAERIIQGCSKRNVCR